MQDLIWPKRSNYFHSFTKVKFGLRVNPPITQIGHVLKTVLFSLIFQLNTKMSESCFVSILWLFIICPVADAISLTEFHANGHFFKQFSQVVVYFTSVGRGAMIPQRILMSLPNTHKLHPYFFREIDVVGNIPKVQRYIIRCFLNLENLLTWK